MRRTKWFFRLRVMMASLVAFAAIALVHPCPPRMDMDTPAMRVAMAKGQCDPKPVASICVVICQALCPTAVSQPSGTGLVEFVSFGRRELVMAGLTLTPDPPPPRRVVSFA